MKALSKEIVKDNHREVAIEDAIYAIILRPKSYDTSICLYASKEDMEWALGNSWFNYQEAYPVKLLQKDVLTKENK